MPSSAAAAGTIPANAQPIAWLPATVGMVTSLGPSRATIPLYLDSISRVTNLRCWSEVRAGFTHWYGVFRTLGSAQSQVARWTLPRESVERCVLDVLHALGIDASARRDGMLTEFTASDGSRSVVGWTADGWAVWNDSRAEVDALLAPGLRITTNGAMMTAMVRVASDATVWSASSLDATTPFVGVPSTWWFFEARGTGPDAARATRLRMRFASTALALDAQRRIAAFADRPGWSAATRAALTALGPVLEADEVEIRPSGLMEPTVLRELEPLLRARADAGAR